MQNIAFESPKPKPSVVTAEQYLSNHNVELYFADAVKQLLEFKSENVRLDPSVFLHEYFSSVNNGTHTLFRDYYFVSATPRNRSSFLKNFWDMFKHMATNGDLLNIKDFHSLVCLLCPDFSYDILQRTVKIVLLDDSSDCLMSFSDFIYAFQFQFYYLEFIDKCQVIYSKIQNYNTEQCVDAFNSLDLDEEQETQSKPKSDDVSINAKAFLEAVKRELYMKRFAIKFSLPPEYALHEILGIVSHVTFYGFLMALTKSSIVNKSVGVLPERVVINGNTD